MSRNIQQDAAVKLRVVNALTRRLDTRQRIVRPLRQAADLLLRTFVQADTRQRITGTVRVDASCRQRVAGDVARDGESRQTVFAVRIEESHQIET